MKKVFALLVVLVAVVALLMMVISRLRKETRMPLVQPGAYEQSQAVPFREAEILTGEAARLIEPAIEFAYVSADSQIESYLARQFGISAQRVHQIIRG